MKKDAENNLLPIIKGRYRQGKSAGQLKCWRRSSRQYQWEELAEVDFAPYMDILFLFWCTNKGNFLADPPVIRSPTSSLLGKRRTPPTLGVRHRGLAVATGRWGWL